MLHATHIPHASITLAPSLAARMRVRPFCYLLHGVMLLALSLSPHTALFPSHHSFRDCFWGSATLLRPPPSLQACHCGARTRRGDKPGGGQLLGQVAGPGGGQHLPRLPHTVCPSASQSLPAHSAASLATLPAQWWPACAGHLLKACLLCCTFSCAQRSACAGAAASGAT